MGQRNVFAKFAACASFMNVGLLIASSMLCLQYLSGQKAVSELAWVDPILAYATATCAIVIGIFTGRSKAHGFNAWRDSIPLLAFSVATLLAGVQKPWAWMLFVIAAVGNAALFYGKRYADYDEEEDRIAIHWRWPF